MFPSETTPFLFNTGEIALGFRKTVSGSGSFAHLPRYFRDSATHFRRHHRSSAPAVSCADAYPRAGPWKNGRERPVRAMFASANPVYSSGPTDAVCLAARTAVPLFGGYLFGGYMATVTESSVTNTWQPLLNLGNRSGRTAQQGRSFLLRKVPKESQLLKTPPRDPFYYA
jgi:hypothetical protein